MARMARVVGVGQPHHVTQRGNRRLEVFFERDDYASYIGLRGEFCKECGTEVWAYCLMPNHVHLVLVPHDEDGLRAALAEAHRRYTRRINFREGWRGHLWQGRFASFPMDEHHLLAATRYIELNPVRARLVEEPEDYEWSSARARVLGGEDKLLTKGPLDEMIRDWKGFLDMGLKREELRMFRSHEKTGRPLGNNAFLESLETSTGRTLKRKKPGPKRNDEEGSVGN